MARPRTSGAPATETTATGSAVDVATAIDRERRRLERRLATALRTLAKRLDQLVDADESKRRRAVAKRRRQADEAAAKVAELTDKLAILAGSGVDTGASPPIAAVKAVGAATARAAKPVTNVAGSAAKAAGNAAKAAGSAAGNAAGSAAKTVGSAAKAAGVATTRVRKASDPGPDGAP